MKKALIVILILYVAAFNTACGNSDNESKKSKSDKSAVVINITSKKPTESTTETVKITEEVVQKATKNKNLVTEPTTKTINKKTKNSSKIPTQGQTKPNTYVTVTTSPIGSFSKKDLDFVFDGAYIYLNDDIEDAFAIIGEDNSVREISKTKIEYQYDNLTLVTYTSNKKEKVEQITVTSDSLATPKGAKIGMYATKLKLIYGIPDKKTDSEYTYTKGNKSLTFSVENNIVTSYCYRLKTK